MDLDEWMRMYEHAALTQGWCIWEVDHPGNHKLEVQKIDDAPLLSEHKGIHIPQLHSDDEAVSAMRAAYDRGEDHAIAARELLRGLSPQEYAFWRMGTW